MKKNSREAYDEESEIEIPDQPLKPQVPDPKARQKEQEESCGCSSHQGKVKSKRS